MADCPSCGRFVGPYEACPYCGAAQTGRTPVRLIKVAALVLALGGLALLWLLATQTRVPRVEIGQVNSTMNMAYVRVEGLVNRSPSYDPEGDYLSFWVADDTGEVMVSVYRNETRELVRGGRVPQLGDWVEVKGTLRVREDFVGLTLNLPQSLEITRPQPVEREAADVTSLDEFLRVRLRGQVRGIRTPYEGLTLVGLRDDSGEIEVAISQDLALLGGELPELRAGQTIEVVGSVSLYKDTPQLNLTDPADLSILEEKLVVAPETPIGQIGVGQVDQWVTVEGRVLEVAPFSAGVKYGLDDGSGQITLLLWDSVYQALPKPEALGPGAVLRVQGEVSEYRGELELLPEVSSDVTVLVEGGSQVAQVEAEAVQVGQLSPDDVGRRVRLTGSLGPPQPFSSGVKFNLDDGSGQIILLLWQDVYDALPQAEELGAGSQVQVTGQIEAYRGELEIVPASADGVQLVGAGPTPTSPPQATATAEPTPEPTASPVPEPAASPIPESTPPALGDVDAGLVGHALSLRGTVVDAESFSRGFQFTLDDGSGQIVLLTWLDLYDQIAGREGLRIGATVEVRGEIGQFEGELQIVPAQAVDVDVVVPGSGPEVEVRQIASLTEADVGSWVAVAGEVGRSEGFSGGLRLYLSDGSGEVMVLVWQNVLERVPNEVGLTTVGQGLRVVGRVETYQGTLEIVPVLPFDVEPGE